MNSVKKRIFPTKEIQLESGDSLPITLGYESYGKLNSKRDNLIVIPHYFSGTSHGAGRYFPGEIHKGYWDTLIGPGKAVDTNDFFVVSIDSLCNIQWKSPRVITTGPRSFRPGTKQVWGSDFPSFTFRDIARIQSLFLKEQFGIERIYAALGASAGGSIAFEWAILEPNMIERVVSVVANPFGPIATTRSLYQRSMRAIARDSQWKDGNYQDGEEPWQGLYEAMQLIYQKSFSPDFYLRLLGHKHSATSLSQKEIENYIQEMVRKDAALMDPSHWYYMCQAVLAQDICRGYSSKEEAFQRVQAKILMISCLQDQLIPPKIQREILELLNRLGKKVKGVEFESIRGHMAGILESRRFSRDIRDFLQ